MWIYPHIWTIGNNNCALLHQLNETAVQLEKFFMFFGSFWIDSIFALLYYALHRGGHERNNIIVKA